MDEGHVTTSTLKAKCSEIIDGVLRRRTPVVITRRGRAVARLVPVEEGSERESLFGFAKGCVQIKGDILAPVDVEWEAAA